MQAYCWGQWIKSFMRRCPCSHCWNTCNKRQDELSYLRVSLTLPFLHKLGERQSKIILVLLLPESQRACFLLYPFLHISFMNATHTALLSSDCTHCYNLAKFSHHISQVCWLDFSSMPHELGEYMRLLVLRYLFTQDVCFTTICKWERKM